VSTFGASLDGDHDGGRADRRWRMTNSIARAWTGRFGVAVVVEGVSR